MPEMNANVGEHPEQSRASIERRKHFREAFLIGAHIHLEQYLAFDARLSEGFDQGHYEEPVPQFVALSFTNAFAGTGAEEGSMRPALTMCFRDKQGVYAGIGAPALYRRMFIHVPVDEAVKPRTQEEIESLPAPKEVYVEYVSPMSKTVLGGRKPRFKTTRFVVNEDDIYPYVSYDAETVQLDELDLVAREPNRLLRPDKYNDERKISEVSNMIHVIEHWDEEPVKWLQTGTISSDT